MKLYVTIFLYLLFVSVSFSQSDDWIVGLNEKLVIDNSKKTDNTVNVRVLSESLFIYQFKFDKEISYDDLMTYLPKHTSIRSISENQDLEIRMTPNDSLYSEQYHLDLIQAERVWAETTGNSTNNTDYVIALLDDGYDITHRDLDNNFWTNPSEAPLDLRDNDNNGFIDDHMGINIEDSSGNHAVDTHGTLVSGIMGAEGNNTIGVTGVLWDTDILLISGVSNVAEIIAGFDYVYNLKKAYIDSDGILGANVIVNNFSGGVTGIFPQDFPEWCDMYDLLGSVGILSVGAVANDNFDVEIVGDLPTLCTSDFLITVTNTNQNDERVMDAAFGITSVDIAAPGEEIISTANGNTYGTISGTSASSPQVAAGIALLYTIDCEVVQDLAIENPSNMALTMKDAIMTGVDVKSTLDATVSKGRLNLYNSLLELASLCTDVELTELQVFDISPNPISIGNLRATELDFNTDSFDEHTFMVHDIMGKLLYYEKFTPSVFNARSISLSNVPDLSHGIYSFSIKNESEIESTAIVVID